MTNDLISAVMSQMGKKGGSAKTAKKTASSQINARKAAAVANAEYTREKRIEAAKKAWETRRAKSKNQE